MRRVFISYSHDSEEHKKWVEELALALQLRGVEVQFDQWDLDYGDDLAAFMESGIRDMDRVLVIATEKYVEKANAGVGGVGYEKTIMSAEMLSAPQNRRKFLPIVVANSGEDKLPTCFGAALYLDFSNNNDYEDKVDDLLNSINKVEKSKISKKELQFIAPDAALTLERDDQAQRPRAREGSLLVEYAHRFSQSFPGTRGVRWIESESEIQLHMMNFLGSPLVYENGHLLTWTRGPSNLHIENFEHVEGRHYLMNWQELNISKIAAVSDGISPGKMWVYVEVSPDEPTGLNDIGPEQIEWSVESLGYCSEEYGLVDGTMPITRAEYDDGAAYIDGTAVDVSGRTTPRERILTPYNFILAPHSSAVTDSSFDYELQDHCNQILSGRSSVDDLANRVRQLPAKTPSW